MSIIADSTWMKNQKHATVMTPGRDFQVVQTKENYAVFFSIGTGKYIQENLYSFQ